MRPGRPVSLLLLALLLALPFGNCAARASEEKAFDWNLSGAYNKSAAERSSEDDTGDDTDAPALARLRAGVEIAPAAVFRTEAAYEVNCYWVENIAEQGYADPVRLTRLRIDDLDRELSESEDRVVTQNLDRLNFETRLGGGSVLTLGRQAIGHGSGRFFNPTDIFAPVAPQSTYSEYKQGVDALRFDLPFGETFEWNLWAVAHRDGAEKSYYLTRVRALYPLVSLSAYAGATLGEATVALDLSGPLLAAEWHLEGIMRLDEPPSRSLRAAGGIHHRFPWKMNFLAEVHFNGVGRSDPDEYYLVTQSREWRNGEIFLAGRWYTCVGIDFEPLPLLTAGVTWLQNTDDGSALIQPAVGWSLTDRFTFRAGASKGYGKAPDRVPLSPVGADNLVGTVAAPNSEFGSYSDVAYGELSFDF